MKLARELGDLDGERVAVLVRLRSGRCFYADPPLAAGARIGRPRRHGAKFACADPATWWAPSAEHREAHAQYGVVRVRAWAGVHTKTQNHPDRGSRRTKRTLRGTLILVEVERLPRQTRIPKQLWLWWRGPGTPDLAVLWRARPPLRPGAYLPLLQADAQLDHAPRPPPRAGRSLDLAGPAGLHPTPTGPLRHRGPAPPRGAPPASDPPRPHAGSRAPGVSAAPGRPRLARRSAKTLRTVTGPPARTPVQ